ncbi:hypothetical protein WJX84_000973 [Apatococcus fuscideae]|uniref:RNA helicase n=1 Tax=Apatococcus fuscideae TaxID=2026836 RepID=A0AAW1SPL8_9CHLO
MLFRILASGPGKQQQRPGWQAIILVPTRELCKQVKEEADRVVEKCGGHIKVTALTGEGSEATQRNMLLTIGQLVVSTPGRIAQALRSGQVQPSMLAAQPKAGRPGLSTVVLDEADLMLSMPGYEADLRDIFPKLPSSCQRILMSATTSPEVKSLMQLALTNPLSLDLITFAVGPEMTAEAEGEDGEPSTSGRIDHFSFSCTRQDKLLAVLALLKLGLVSKKVLLFTNSVEPAFRLRLFLEAFGLRAALLSPDLPLNTRHHILQTFNKGLFDYLIAADTQVAGLGLHEAPPRAAADAAPAKDRSDKRRKRKREGAEDDAEYGVSRGVDFKGVSTVINVDCPAEVSKYVHRVGRTGRAGQSGTALTLFTPEDRKLQTELEASLAGQAAPHAAASNGDENAVDPQNTIGAMPSGGLASQEGLGPFSTLKPAALDALRYRAEDVARSLTKTVIQEARAKELRAELLNSKRLEAHFEAHPGTYTFLNLGLRLLSNVAASCIFLANRACAAQGMISML